MGSINSDLKAFYKEAIRAGAIDLPSDSGSGGGANNAPELPPEPEEWPEVIAFDAANKLPSFPVEHMPDWLRRFVSELSTATQTPVDLAAMVTLATLAASVAGKIKIEIRQGWQEPLNLYIAVALPPASRKSSVFNECSTPILEYEKELIKTAGPEVRRKKAECEMLEAALGEAKRAGIKALAVGEPFDNSQVERLADMLERFEIPVIPRIVADDCTLERMAGMLAEQKGRLAIMSAEGDLFDILGGRYSAAGSVNIGVVLKGHAGDFLKVDRVSRGPVSVDNPALTIGLAIQPDVLKGLMKKSGFLGRGLLGRFLYSLPPSNIGRREIKPPPISEAAKEAYATNITRLLEFPIKDEPQIIHLDEGAEASLTSFQEWIEPELKEGGTLASFTDWAGKLAGAVARIAGLIHLARAGSPERAVTFNTMHGAIQIGKYLIEHAKAAYGIMGADEAVEDAKKFWQWIEARGYDTFKYRELHQAVKGSYPKAEMLLQGLKLLVERGYIREMAETQKRAGRPSVRYEINPACATQNSQKPQKQKLANNIEDFENKEDDISDLNLWEGEI